MENKNTQLRKSYPKTLFSNDFNKLIFFSLGLGLGLILSNKIFLNKSIVTQKEYIIPKSNNKTIDNYIYTVFQKHKYNVSVASLPLVNYQNIFWLRDNNYYQIDTFEKFYDYVENRFNKKKANLESWAIDNPIELRVLFYMQYVSGLWNYGNADKLNWQKVGCVLRNEDNNWNAVSIDKINIRTYLDSKIGCCSDYAYMLGYLLDRAEIQNRVIQIPGHIFNEVYFNDTWNVIDANTGIYINKSWKEVLRDGDSDPNMKILTFPHKNQYVGESYRSFIPAFQIFMIQKAIVGKTEKDNMINYLELPTWFNTN